MQRIWRWLKNEAVWSWVRNSDRQLVGGTAASLVLIFVLRYVTLSDLQQEQLFTLLIVILNYTWYRFVREQGKHVARNSERENTADSGPKP